MDLGEYVAAVRKRWRTAVILTFLVVLGAVAATLAATPVYKASTRLFFAVQASDSVSDLAQGSSFTEKQMSSYAQVATSPLVLDAVARDLDLEIQGFALADSVAASVPANTVIVEVAATDTDPQRAAEIANAVGRELATAVAGLYPDRPDGTQAVLATTLSPATAPGSPSSPDVQLNLALGLVAGLVIGVGVVVLMETLDTKIRSARDVAAVTDCSIIGAIQYDVSAPNHPIVMIDQPSSLRAEAVRRLRTNLQFVDLSDGLRTILVTSSVPMEGKSTTVVNLAVALAYAGRKVVLVDADLRRPSIARLVGLEGGAGLTSVLIGQAKLEDVLQPWTSGQLDVLTAGPIPPNPSELLGSAKMLSLINDLAERYDAVLIDSPPLIPVTDGAILAKRTAGSILVVGADRVHRAQLAGALEMLDAVGARVLGIALNKVAARNLPGSGYRASYSYEYSPGPDPGRRQRQRGRRSRKRARGRPTPAPEMDAGRDLAAEVK